MIAESIDMYMSTLTYLRYEELLRMPVPTLSSLLEVHIKKMSKNPQGGSGLGALTNLLGGGR